MAKQPRVWDGSQWQELAVTLPDLSNYSTTTQMNTAIDNAKGLVLVANATVTAGTTLNINNCFTSTYKNYRVVVDGHGSANSQLIYARLRASGSDITSNYNGGTDGTDPTNAGSGTRWKVAETTAMALGYISTSSSAWNLYSFDLTSPQLTNFKIWTGTFLSQNSGVYNYMGVMGGLINSSTSCDGITFYSANNLTINVKIYGYRNS